MSQKALSKVRTVRHSAPYTGTHVAVIFILCISLYFWYIRSSNTL